MVVFSQFYQKTCHDFFDKMNFLNHLLNKWLIFWNFIKKLSLTFLIKWMFFFNPFVKQMVVFFEPILLKNLSSILLKNFVFKIAKNIVKWNFFLSFDSWCLFRQWKCWRICHQQWHKTFLTVMMSFRLEMEKYFLKHGIWSECRSWRNCLHKFLFHSFVYRRIRNLSNGLSRNLWIMLKSYGRVENK